MYPFTLAEILLGLRLVSPEKENPDTSGNLIF